MSTEELGDLGKTLSDEVMTNRKVYVVTLVQPAPGAPEGFDEKYNAYWEAVDQQVSQLESRAGIVKRVFAEGVIGRGDDAKLMIQQANPGAHRLVNLRLSAGAVFEEFEDTDIFGQVIDWGRCLQSGLINQTVADEIQKQYTEAANKRGAHLLKRLNEGIQESEAALILTGDQNLPLPDGVEKFIVSPPELDELNRWVQQANETIRQQMMEEQAKASGGASDTSPDESQGKTTDSGLWTPG